MPKGHPINPEITRIRMSEAQKNRVRSPEWYKKVREMLVKRNKSRSHINKVKKALMGHGFSPETLQKMRDNHANQKGENNNNWRGDDVGIIGIHLWLSKNFKKKLVCEFCGKSGSSYYIEWAKLKDKPYARDRNNFIELCRKCHRNYDFNKEYCKRGHKLTKDNLYNNKDGHRVCKMCNKYWRTKCSHS